LHLKTRARTSKAATEAVIDTDALVCSGSRSSSRERRSSADTAADRCTELAAALAALPSRPLEMVADAVAALGCADA
jgi:hypothetical protein